MYGSHSIVVEDALRTDASVKRDMRLSGRFPKVGPNHDRLIAGQFMQLNGLVDSAGYGARKKMALERSNAQGEMDRLQEAVRQGRNPNLRSVQTRLANLHQVINRLGAALD